MTRLCALPLAVLLGGVALCLFARRSIRAQRTVVLLVTGLLVGLGVALVLAVGHAGPLRLQVGGWRSPFGIALRVDMLSALMVLITAIIGVATAVYSIADIPRSHLAHGFYPVFLLLLMGVCGAFLTADLFNLYVWFELMLIASFVLISLGGDRDQLRGGFIYVTLNLVSSALFLIGVGLLYGAVRTLDMGDIGNRMVELGAERPGLALALQVLLLTSFGIKAAVFPLFFWLPASYHTPSPSVSALFAGLLTKVGVYAMFRITAGVLLSPDSIHRGLILIAGATMLVGVLGALAQRHMRRLLSFHIVSQIGYMVAGLGLATGHHGARRFALAAGIFFVIHNILAKTSLFFVAGVVRRLRGTEALVELGGVARGHPLLGLLFLISALSLAGTPPLFGFWAKLAVFRAGVLAGENALVTVAVVTGLLTLLSMLKIWSNAFTGEAPESSRPQPAEPDRRDLALLYAPIVLLASLTLAIGLFPDPLFELALAAAEHLVAAQPGGGTR